MDFPSGAVVKNLPASAGGARDSRLLSGSGRSSTERNGNPSQYSCLENSKDRGAWWAAVCEVAESDVTEYNTAFFFMLFSIMLYYRVLNIVPCAIQ